MMTCAQLTELVTEYLEGRLGLGQRLAFQMHVGMCRNCRMYLKQVRQTVRLTGKLPEEPIPAAVKTELLERFRNWHGGDAPADDDQQRREKQ